MIQFSKAIKNYGNKIIGPIDLDVKKGEVVGFLGPNGSGKTTCIRLILGLIHPSSGTVRVNGFDPVSKHVHALSSVAYSPELPNIQTFLTPNEFLSLIAHELGISNSGNGRRDEIKRVLEVVGLSEYANIKVGKLSKGMVQRLSVGQALLGSPGTLILDEPMIGLDPAGAAHFREIFREFSENDRGTVFMSSHIMSEVESLCTSIAIIHSGKILFRGSVDEVIREVLDYSLVILEAEGLTQPLIDKIREIQGVTEVVRNGNSNTVEIIVHGRDDIRPAVSDLLIRAGAKLYTIKSGDNMLERAYIEALKQDQGSARR